MRNRIGDLFYRIPTTDPGDMHNRQIKIHVQNNREVVLEKGAINTLDSKKNKE